MNRNHIIEILESYRRGEGLEADQEVRRALELAQQDPELSALQASIRDFDQAFGRKLLEVDVPASLKDDILAAARRSPATPAADSGPDRKLIAWFHPAAFGIAAAIIIFLALSFTFWNRPGSAASEPSMATFAPLIQTTDTLYARMNPSFRSEDSRQILDYLRNQGGLVPTAMPPRLPLENSFACDVIQYNGATVSLICFKAPDGNGKLHLFTFSRADFPGIKVPEQPQLRTSAPGAKAVWASGPSIHVLYSDKGEENLRRALDI